MTPIQEQRRRVKIAQAQAAIKSARLFISRRPAAEARPIVDNMVSVAETLIEELLHPATGD